MSSNEASKADPVVSIVMPSYQQKPFLREAVASVLEQEGAEVELIVMDPGSRDGSRLVLAELAARYGPRLRPIFEKDKGQADGVNRGVGRARGRVLGWLNSDDRLRPGALRVVAPLLDTDEPRWLYGRAGMIDRDGRPTGRWIARYKSWRGRRFSRFKLLTENFIPQMAVFWNRAMWELAGGLDTSRELDLDYDLWLRFAALREPTVLDVELADFRVHAEAKGSRAPGRQLDEALRTARAHAAELGWRGRVALWFHRIYGARTRFLYRWLKPRADAG
jgi:glycosyltransferase involved in cell wall biosynthesis